MPKRCTDKVVKTAREASGGGVLHQQQRLPSTWQNAPAHLLPPAQRIQAALEQFTLFRMVEDAPSLQCVSLAIDFPSTIAAQMNEEMTCPRNSQAHLN